MNGHRGTVSQCIDSPNPFKEPFSRKDNTPVFHEELQDLEFPIRQMNFPLLTKHAARIRLQDKVLAGQPLHHSPALPFQLRIAREMCLDPCHEFAGAEGLCHVIVRPKAKPADLVDIGLTCRHDDDWDIEFGPDAAAEIESIDMREHEIQDDEVETTAQRSYLSFGAVFLNHYLKIRCFQIIPLQFCDLTIILHDEDFFMMLILSSRLSLRYLVFFLIVLFGKPQADAKAMR